jgi:N-acyl-D-aspartate/D-glutamate deacylase
VRERKALSLEDAIHKMTGMTADHLGIKDRGYIKEGNFADLVLLDPSTVIDNAIIGNSNALSTGIKMVWVNGKIVYQNQQSTGIHSGVLIQRK